MEEKKNKKELTMTIVVVLLAFGLTVAGIIYLTNTLLGGSPTQTTMVAGRDNVTGEMPIVSENGEDDIVRFTLEDPVPSVDNTTSTSQTATPTTADPLAIVVPPAEVTRPTPTTTPPATTTPPQVALAPTPKTNFELQLFASQNRTNAESELTKYKRDYPDAYIVSAEINGQTWYRARCCGAETKEQALLLKSQVENKHKIIPMIVAK